LFWQWQSTPNNFGQASAATASDAALIVVELPSIQDMLSAKDEDENRNGRPYMPASYER
jgi:phage/plasmid primase-like uncharacterized protein